MKFAILRNDSFVEVVNSKQEAEEKLVKYTKDRFPLEKETWDIVNVKRDKTGYIYCGNILYGRLVIGKID